MTCQVCQVICHSECAKKFFNFNHATNQWACYQCSLNKLNRYNPFSSLGSNKHELFSLEDIDDIKTISKILNSCNKLNYEEFRPTAKSHMTSDNISIVFNNIDGNSSNFDSFVADISQYKSEFSFIAIAETNLNEENKGLYQISGYNSEYNSKKRGKLKGSGLGIYISDKYQSNKVEKLCSCSDNIESLFIEITNTEIPQFIGVIYRPPSGNVTDFINEFELLLKDLPSNNVHIVGDFNIDLLGPKCSQFENLVYANNMIPTVSVASHEMPGCKPTLIDNILTNSTDNLVASGVFSSRVSHHHPIFCIMKSPMKADINSTRKYPKYDYSITNTDTFLLDIENKLKLVKFDYDSADSFEEFIGTLNECIESNFLIDEDRPLKSKRNKLLNPWITNGIIVSIQQKSFHYLKWKKSCNKTNKFKGDERLYLLYKEFRLKLRKIIKAAKKSYYSTKFDSVKGNIKKTWELINELRGKTKSNIKASFIIDGELVVDQREISNKFNNFFASIARKVNAKVYSSSLVKQEQDEKFRKHLRKAKSSLDSMFMTHCTKDEIRNIVSDLESGKASDISIPLLKKSSTLLLDHITKYYSSFMERGIFPVILKRGSITPIYKKSDPRYLDNYRPVSTLPIFGKILEKILYSRLYNYFTSKGIIHKNQFGFRKNHSTSHAVNYSVNHVLDHLDSKHHVIGIFLDLSKAFDTISHSKLLKKLDFYGVRGKCLDIIASYLSDRQQYTNFQGSLSSELPVDYGVPQGSVLGPLLFLVYINDIAHVSERDEFVMFADDTNIFISGENEREVHECANEVLKNVEEFMFDNMLHINATKSCYMYFRPNICMEERLSSARTREFGRECSITLCNQKLKRVKSVKFLGVIIDEELSWDAHIEHLSNTLNSSIAMIKRIRKFVPTCEHRKLYDALFASHLSYCITSWGGVSDYKLSRIFSIQKRCVRLLFGKELTFDHLEYYQTCARVRSIDQHRTPKNYVLEHTKPTFNEKNILNLENLYKKQTFMELFKCLKFSSPISLGSFYDMSDRAEKFLLRVPLIRSLRQKKNFVYNSCVIWNSIINFTISKSRPESSGVVVTGTLKNSDLTISVPVMKFRLVSHLLKSLSVRG